MTKPPLDAVLFDLDSTLCRYSLTVAEVIAQAFERLGLKASEIGSAGELEADYNAAWWTAEDTLKLPTEELRRRAWTSLLARRGTGDEALARRIADAYSEIRDETGLELFEGMRPFLDALRPRYRTGILTNGPSDMQWGKLRGLELVDAVDVIVVAGDLGIFKPDPRPFCQLLDALGVEASRALFVGDSYEHDIVGAHRVGMKTAWIVNGHRPRPVDEPPDFVLARTTDLWEVLL